MEARLFGKKWHNLDPPRHLTFFEEKHVNTMAMKYGFECQRFSPLPFPNGFAGSLSVICAGRFNLPLYLISLPLGILFSRIFPSDIMGYWLIKK